MVLSVIPSHTKEAEVELCVFAAKYNLILTGGSDFHGQKNEYAQCIEKLPNNNDMCYAYVNKFL